MKQALKIVGAEGGPPTPFDGKYVKFYDPHVGDHGKLEVTADLQDAMHYADAALALEAWRAVNKNRPTRPDGKPNRPLTAFTVQLVRVP